MAELLKSAFEAQFGFQLFAAFAAGLLASLTPCVYPLIPITVGILGAKSQSTLQSRVRIFSFCGGQSAAFVVMGFIAVFLGESFGFSSELMSVRVTVGALIFVAGILSFRSVLPKIFSRFNGATASLDRWVQKREMGWVSAFAVGVGSALIASPCSSPILGGVLAVLASQSDVVRGLTLMGAYSIGFSFVFLALGLGLSSLSRLPKAGVWMARLHTLSAWVLVIAGLYWMLSPFIVA
jgi:cytochrome c biogenesis protein CcdA